MHQLRRHPRLASVAVVLAIGSFALVGCRSDPDVAAYVGSTRYSEDRVTAIADDAQAKLQAATDRQGALAGVTPEPVDRPVTEQEVVAALIGRDLLKALAQEKNVSPVNLDTSQAQLPVPAEAEYAKLMIEKDSYRAAILQSVSAAPSEADMREVYDNFVKTSNGRYTDSFEEFTSALAAQDKDFIGRSAVVRKDIEAKARDLDVVINPRYTPVRLSLVDVSDQMGGVYSLLAASLDAHESGVRDLG